MRILIYFIDSHRFYPFHYSPYLSDVAERIGRIDLDRLRFRDRGRPFKPFEQLMAVLPARSGRKCLPKAFHSLFEPTSFIYDFYPDDFVSDLNDKKNDWEAVVCIPFIEEERLLAAVQSKTGGLTQAERQRNVERPHLFCSHDSAAQKRIMSPNRCLADLVTKTK